MKKVLILQNKFIGDVLASASIANNLHRIHPEWKIDFFCYKPAEAILLENSAINEIITFDDNELRKFSKLIVVAKHIKERAYDIIIDPYAKLQSRYIVFKSGAPIKISYNKPIFKHIYTHIIPQAKTSLKGNCRALEDRLSLLKPLVPKTAKLNYSFEVFLNEREVKEGIDLMMEAGLDLTKKTLMLGILGSKASKTWSLKSMARVVSDIQQNTDCNLLLNYIPNQKDQVDEFLSYLPSHKNLYPNLVGKGVREYLKIMNSCAAYIGNEGGGINMAKALNCPTFSIYSPHKFPEVWGCMEHQAKHQSVHVREEHPEYFIRPNDKELENNASFYYNKLSPDYVSNKVLNFIHQNVIDQPIIPIKNTGITALLICKNEEKNIRAYLSEVDKFADEIVIVDSESTDNTIAIAKKHPKVKIFVRHFDSFSSQRNYAISKATNIWVTFFDADERIPYPLIAEILHVVKSKRNTSAFYVGRKFFIQEKRLRFSGWQNDKAIRLFKKTDCHYKEDYLVHEILEVKGSTGILKNKLHHYSFPNYEEYQSKLSFYSKLRAIELYKRGVQPNSFHFYVKPAFRFVHHYFVRFGFLDGKDGLRMSKMLANYVHKRYEHLNKLWNDEKA